MTNPGSSAQQVPHTWSKEAFLAKAQRFTQEMLTTPRDSWQFGLWSTLAFESLARAALANISPALLAEPKDWNNLYFALGQSPKAQKFVPKSINITTVFSRLQELVPSFDTNLEGLAAKHMATRNEELHSGTTPFDTSATSTWLPNYYRTCKVLLESMGESLEMLVGPDEVMVASEMIAAAQDESAKGVKASISAFSKVWSAKEQGEKYALIAQAKLWASRHSGHRVTCPSCGSVALVAGSPVAPPSAKVVDGQVIETQFFLPEKFECIACGLKISGLPELHAADLSQEYKATFTYDAAQYYAAAEDPYDGYEPDYNEP